MYDCIVCGKTAVYICEQCRYSYCDMHRLIHDKRSIKAHTRFSKSNQALSTNSLKSSFPEQNPESLNRYNQSNPKLINTEALGIQESSK